MHDFNSAITDPALIKREDIVKSRGPGYVDYAYQTISMAKRPSPQSTPMKPEAVRDAIRRFGVKAKAV